MSHWKGCAAIEQMDDIVPMISHVCIIISYSTNDQKLDGLVKDCSISIANALEILQSCTKPSICW